MQRITYLGRYRLCTDRVGIPTVIRRTADEATFEADDLENGSRVALQIIPTTNLSETEREQLTNEARTAREIIHPNIPVLRDFGFSDDQLVYVTDPFGGTTAEEWIRTKGPMPPSAVLRIASQMVSALVAASLHGILHCAVNPASIMLVPGETAAGEWPLIKLLNLLGIAPSLSPSLGFNFGALNPADFASPEQLRSGAVTFRSGIYSLGSTLWYLLTGAPVSDRAAVLAETNGLSALVRQLLASMLAENPAERPLDPLALQQQIQICLAQMERRDVDATTFGFPPVVAPTLAPLPAMTVKPMPARRPSRRPLALAAILLALGLLAAFFFGPRLRANFALRNSTEPLALTPAAAPKVAPKQIASRPSLMAAPEEEPASTPSFVINSELARAPEISEPAAAPIEPRNLISGREVTMLEAQKFPASLELPPPAEGPDETITTIAEVSPFRPMPFAPEEAETNLPIEPAPLLSAKVAKPDRVARPVKKRTKVVAEVPDESPTLAPPRIIYQTPTVGHLFPAWPARSPAKKPSS